MQEYVKSRPEKYFMDTFISTRILRIFYGNITKKQMKKIIRGIRKKKHIKLPLFFIGKLERRLSTIVYRTKLVESVVEASQMIRDGSVFVNNNVITKKSYLLKVGDIVSFSSRILHCIRKKRKLDEPYWPMPPKHLLINHKTMQILLLDFKKTYFLHNFHFPLNLDRVLNSFI